MRVAIQAVAHTGVMRGNPLRTRQVVQGESTQNSSNGPGEPTQNSFVERFNRTFRTEVLDMYVFRDLDEVREISRNWI